MAQGFIQVRGGNELILALNKFAKNVSDFSDPLEEATDKVKKHAEGPVFSTQGGAIGEKWKSGPNYHGLVQSGAMKGSFMTAVTRFVGVIGNADRKFRFHQLSNSRIAASPRTMLKWATQNKRLVQNTSLKWLNKIPF